MMFVYASCGGVSNFRFTQNNQEDRTMAAIIEAAYLAGFEPSSDDLTPEALYAEAEEYLMKSIQY